METNKMAQSKNYFYALGRRKTATARVRLTTGTGNITVNKRPASDYFSDSDYLIEQLNLPFKVVDSSKFDISAVVVGGGPSGQAEAVRSGIAKALIVFDENLKSTLKRADLLGRDPREKERKKFGLKGARKQRQFTKR
jgi:small subunit ribosomal protein S9